MKATSFLRDDPGLSGAWARLAQALIFNPLRRDGAASEESPRRAKTPSGGGFFDRIDRWFWRQAQRDQEAYLARSCDIYDLEQRIRLLERAEGSRFF